MMAGKKLDKKTQRSIIPHMDGEAYTKYFSGVYDSLTEISGWRKKIRKYALSNIEPCLMLDVGCGTGFLLKLAREKGFDYHGIDPSEGMLDKAIEVNEIPRERLIKANAHEIPFPDNHFDLVTASGSMMYTPNLEETSREMVRVVKPGGIIRIIDHAKPVKNQFWTFFAFVFSQMSGQILHDYPHYFEPYCEFANHTVLGRGGYLQMFDFKKK